MKPSTIEKEALHLSARERAKLAHRLLESLDDLPEADAEKVWASEVSRRAKEIDEGKVELVSSEALEQRIQARLK